MENILLFNEYVDIKSYKIRALIELLEKIELKHDLFYKKQFAFDSVVFKNLYRTNYIESYDKKAEQNNFKKLEKERLKNEIKKLKRIDDDCTLLSNDCDLLRRRTCWYKLKLRNELIRSNIIVSGFGDYELSEILFKYVLSLVYN